MLRKKYGFPLKRHREQGAILAVAIIILTVLLLIAIPLLIRVSSQFRTAEKFYKSVAAVNLAEAGVERAIWELKNGLISPWQLFFGTNGVTLKTNINGFPEGRPIGNIEISVVPSFPSLVVEGTGRVPWSGKQTIDRTVRVVLDMRSRSIFEFGIFADRGVGLGSSVEIDSYDSTQGLYDANKRTHNGRVGTNSTTANSIYLGNNAKIFGNSGVGFGTDRDALDSVINTSAGYLEGTKFILPDEFLLNSVWPPLKILLSIKGEYYYNDPVNIGSISSSNNGTYTSFNLAQGKVRVDGDVTLFILGEFKMDQSTTLEVGENSSLQLYLGGSFVQWQYTAVNNLTKDPSKLLILGTDLFTGEMVWNASSDLYGAIYVPGAEVRYDSTSDLYGGVVCKELDIAANARVHYDEALKEVGAFKGGVPDRFVKSWQQKR